MFEDFTERSSRMIVLAQEEARLLGHSEVGSEHLMLALISDDEGIAGYVLSTFGLEIARARSNAVDLFGSSEPTSGSLPLTTWVRSAIELGRGEADALGHDYVGTEHVLLGLIKMGKGGWRRIMRRFDVNERDVRASVLGVIDAYDRGDVERPQADLSTSSPMRQGSDRPDVPDLAQGVEVFERFAESARKVVVGSQEEARRLDHNYIGTEHILLGLIAEGEGIAARALEAHGIDLESARDQVEAHIGRGQRSPSGHIPFTPRAKKVLELSLRATLDLAHGDIDTEHLLLALLREGEGVAVHALLALDIDVGALEAFVLAERPPGSLRSTPTPPAEPAARNRWISRTQEWTRRAKSGSPFEARYGFSRGIRKGFRVEIAGTAPIPPEGEEVAESAYDQMMRCCEIVQEALEELGASISDVVRTVMYITDVKHSDDVGRAHGEVFGEAAPAATMVVVSGLLDPKWLVEVEAYAQM